MVQLLTEKLIDTAKHLLAIRSTEDRPEELQRALDLVINYVGDQFHVKLFSSQGKPSALIGVEDSGNEFDVLLNAHLDVVPASDEQFRARKTGERLHARGAQDMKITALLMAEAFRTIASKVEYRLGLQLVTDEEVGGYNGTRYQIQNGVRSSFTVVGEFSNLDLVTASKGIVLVALHSEGRAGHSAYPWLADNALLKLQRSLTRIFQAHPLPLEEAWSTTINLSHIDTPNITRNQVPANATAYLDIRYPPDVPEFSGREAMDIEAYLQSMCDGGVTASVERLDAPHSARETSFDLKCLGTAVRRQGYPANIIRKHGAADGRFYSEKGMDAVIFGIGGDGLHGPEEYADLRTLDPYYAALCYYLRTRVN